MDFTGQGVLFVEADSDINLEQFSGALLPPFSCIEELTSVIHPWFFCHPNWHSYSSRSFFFSYVIAWYSRNFIF
jgi:hypothetical protein